MSVTHFGKRLRELRVQKGLTQVEAASRLGVSKSALNMYERGDREPGFEKLQKMCEFYGTDLNDLFGVPCRVPPSGQDFSYNESFSAESEQYISGVLRSRKDLAPESHEMTPDELLLLEAYRALDSQSRARLLRRLLMTPDRD